MKKREKNVLIVGGGKIGVAIVELLTSHDDYRITVIDRDADTLSRLERSNVKTVLGDVSDPSSFAKIVHGHDAVLSAAPYSKTTLVAEAAKRAGVHYLDLTEDVESTRTIKALAEKADCAFVPQCGLAPGFISVAAYDL